MSDYVEDIELAIEEGSSGHFFGTIVLCERPNGLLEVIDGQQRLATTFAFIAVIRDRLAALKKTVLAKRLQERYIEGLDLNSGETRPRLALNVQDNPFLTEHLIPVGGSLAIPLQKKSARASSTRRLQSAITRLQEYVEQQTSGAPANAQRVLLRLVSFLEKRARVIRLVVRDDVSAYTVFETLNDRGVDLAVADLLKNYLFSKAKNRVDEVANAWSQMSGVIDSLRERDAVVQFVSHYWSSRYGLTRRKALFASAKSEISTPQTSVRLAQHLRDTADVYVALANPSHEQWSGSSQDLSEAVRVLSDVLRVVQIRPLLLSIVERFSHGQQIKAFRLLTNCAVRIIVAGVRGGTIERAYNTLAYRVHKKEIKGARELLAAFGAYVPGDQRFEEEFRSLRVSRGEVARYYLATLERTKRGVSAKGITDASPHIGLEHVLPDVFDPAAWPAFNATTHRELRQSIGNLCLLDHQANNRLGNKAFGAKRLVLTRSNYRLTSSVGRCTDWTSAEIESRAEELAAIAPRAWPIKLAVQ